MNGGLKTREPRQKVMVPARLRAGNAYVDVCIRNVSSRGMMLQAASPPAPGTYVELMRADQAVVGRVVWTRERRFGVHISERLDVSAFLSQAMPARASRPGQERHSSARQAIATPTLSDVVQQADRSRRLSRAMEFGLLIGCGTVAAGLLASTAYTVLARPFESAAIRLG